MQHRNIREAIFTLHKKGNGLRTIARALKISRNTVKRVLVSGSVEVPSVVRTESAEPHEERIRALFVLCKGNLVRVHEELAAAGVDSGRSRRSGRGSTTSSRVRRCSTTPPRTT